MNAKLPKFDHLVVLMMENHSADNMIGYLYHPDNPPPYDKPPRGQSFEGVFRTDGKVWTNPIPMAYQDPWGCSEIPLTRSRHFTSPWAADPYHDYGDVQTQLYGDEPFALDPCSTSLKPPATASMNGFVENYIKAIIVEAGGEPTLENTEAIMACFSPCSPKESPDQGYATVPVISTLAVNYAVCDNWYSPLPSATMCNRSFLHAAQSNGWVNNANPWPTSTASTIFNKLLTADFGGLFSPTNAWRIYHDELDPSPLTYQLHPPIWPYEKPPYRAPMEQFFEDARNGTLPAYAFIEPRIVGADNDGRIHNDQHPVCDIRIGENLINQVFQAVASSPCWERTFFIITYDEHGGYFDHVSPPAAVPPEDYPAGSTECGFMFDRYGIRVPAVLISPYIEPGTVFHPSVEANGEETKIAFDHTAVIKTLRNRWGISEPLTARDATSIDLAAVLTRDTPRQDEPMMLPMWSHLGPRTKPELNGFQKDVLKMRAVRALAAISAIKDKDEAVAFLRSAGLIEPE